MVCQVFDIDMSETYKIDTKFNFILTRLIAIIMILFISEVKFHSQECDILLDGIQDWYINIEKESAFVNIPFEGIILP